MFLGCVFYNYATIPIRLIPIQVNSFLAWALMLCGSPQGCSFKDPKHHTIYCPCTLQDVSKMEPPDTHDVLRSYRWNAWHCHLKTHQRSSTLQIKWAHALAVRQAFAGPSYFDQVHCPVCGVPMVSSETEPAFFTTNARAANSTSIAWSSLGMIMGF